MPVRTAEPTSHTPGTRRSAAAALAWFAITRERGPKKTLEREREDGDLFRTVRGAPTAARTVQSPQLVATDRPLRDRHRAPLHPDHGMPGHAFESLNGDETVDSSRVWPSPLRPCCPHRDHRASSRWSPCFHWASQLDIRGRRGSRVAHRPWSSLRLRERAQLEAPPAAARCSRQEGHRDSRSKSSSTLAMSREMRASPPAVEAPKSPSR